LSAVAHLSVIEWRFWVYLIITAFLAPILLQNEK